MTSPDGFIPGSTNTGWGDMSDMAGEFVQGGLLGWVIDLAIQWINNMIASLLDALDGVTGGIFNLDDMADRFRGTERTLANEVPRLDNRIDEIIIGNMQAQLATFSASGTWYKPTDAKYVTVDILGGGSGGGRSNNGGNGGSGRGGRGGYSGGWARLEFDAADLPSEVAITVGAPGSGATSDGGDGTDGGPSSFGSFGSATGGSSSGQAYGSGGAADRTYKIRGGNGASLIYAGGNGLADPGGEGPFAPGGARPSEQADGTDGNPGVSAGVGQIGPGSGGSGGAGKNGTGSGGRGGAGGWPAAPGGGGGHYETFGFAGNGGNGASGAVFVTTRFY
ncbi:MULTISPECIES: hypothetical protein [Rhodococcus]|uniref:glycine-rich domain-containing protein n=1 Tax=Rhodococcus TaxID=1827 RepID=UPI00193B594E|nr:MULTISPECIES: hypothetical protein [Rhodococcus]QRI75999.1 hypothetical protein JQ505_26580 [Rhodococcus aetherivorans]QSE59410.1 hypothetical protein JYA75_27680 [Rhodococcus sp. PSBB066]QSE69265.1 hypothetical protein JYA91_27775 [Rhodococcus sp. PSBB049]